jgi:hypothetical protein
METSSLSSPLRLKDLSTNSLCALLEVLGFRDCIAIVQQLGITGELLSCVESFDEFKEFGFPFRFTAEGRLLFARLQRLSTGEEELFSLLNQSVATHKPV